jgi:hypothetical protein
MNFHPENQIVEIVVPFQDLNGAAIVPTDITAALYNGEDGLVMSFGAVAFDPLGVETRIILPGALNALEGDELQEVRRLDVRITHAAGTVLRSHVYAIEAEQSLQIMRNSFMTFGTAQMMASQLVNLVAFNAETEARQRAALVEAYRRLTNLAMIYAIVDADGRTTSEHRLTPLTWHYIDADAFQTGFPSHFKRALRAAQLAEADELLQGNVIAQKHAQGIASETIGESSVTLRAGFTGASDAGISASALALLSGYIDRSISIGRA